MRLEIEPCVFLFVSMGILVFSMLSDRRNVSPIMLTSVR